MAQVPTIGRIVHYHHPGEGLADGRPRDYPALILEVSGGPLGSATNVEGQTDEEYRCLLAIFAPRKTDWRRCYEGNGSGQWSWPSSLTPEPSQRQHDLIRGYIDEYMTELFDIIDRDDSIAAAELGEGS